MYSTKTKSICLCAVQKYSVKTYLQFIKLCLYSFSTHLHQSQRMNKLCRLSNITRPPLQVTYRQQSLEIRWLLVGKINNLINSTLCFGIKVQIIFKHMSNQTLAIYVMSCARVGSPVIFSQTSCCHLARQIASNQGQIYLTE